MPGLFNVSDEVGGFTPSQLKNKTLPALRKRFDSYILLCIMNGSIKKSGFTIVELLTVIVVLAIVSTMVVIGFNGLQDRAKTASGKTIASQVAEKGKLYAALHRKYPSYDLINALPITDGAHLSKDLKILDTSTTNPLTAVSAQDGKAILWVQSTVSGCGSQDGTYAFVVYWDYLSDQQVAVPIAPGTPSGDIGTEEIPIGGTGCGTF